MPLTTPGTLAWNLTPSSTELASGADVVTGTVDVDHIEHGHAAGPATVVNDQA
jgi:hypothetical protein